MRDIKLKAWNTETKLMGSAATLNELQKFAYRNPHRESDLSLLIWMQYTGLKDKNGKEIYEGDIVSKLGKNLEVYWHNNTACWRTTGHTGTTEAGMALMYEVIGNIYENPELLEEK